jgi:Flp pilus assembly pilin Flp
MRLPLIDTSMGSRRRRHDGREAGAVAIEFALLMAFLPLPILAFGIVDYGAIMAQWTNLTAVVRGAAEYARSQVGQGNGLPTSSQIGALLNAPDVVFTSRSFCTCVDNTLVTCPAAGEPNPCGANTDTRVLEYVSVIGSKTYTPWISGTWPFPEPLKTTTVLRTQ